MSEMGRRWWRRRVGTVIPLRVVTFALRADHRHSQLGRGGWRGIEGASTETRATSTYGIPRGLFMASDVRTDTCSLFSNLSGNALMANAINGLLYQNTEYL